MPNNKIETKELNQKFLELKPIVTEKSVQIREKYQHITFRVRALKVKALVNKNTIAKAFSEEYGVKLDSVKGVAVMNYKPETVLRRGRRGVISGYKKAIIRVAPGTKVDIPE